MKENIRDLLAIAGALATASLIGLATERCKPKERPAREGQATTVVVRHDTVVVRDTIPQEVTRHVVRRDTVRLALVHGADTAEAGGTRGDSAEAIVPIEQTAYSGEGYEAWVSGYRARLDSIRLSIPTTTITVRPKPKRWGIGVQAGYGIAPNKAQPYIGIGISYNLYSW